MKSIAPLVISATFGNYIGATGCTQTVGTFTRYARRTGCGNPYNERCWWLGLAWRLARTLRYSPKYGGWVNKLGLRNPGIDNCYGKLFYTLHQQILSIHGFNIYDWKYLLETAARLHPLACRIQI